MTLNNKADIADAYTIGLNIEVSRSILSQVKSRLLPENAYFDALVEKLPSAIRMLTKRHGIDVMEIEESFGWSLRIAQAKLIPLVVRLHGPWFLNGNFDNPQVSEFRKKVELEGRGIGTATSVTAPSAYQAAIEVYHASTLP